jgi:hypothetical protein
VSDSSSIRLITSRHLEPRDKKPGALTERDERHNSTSWEKKTFLRDPPPLFHSSFHTLK